MKVTTILFLIFASLSSCFISKAAEAGTIELRWIFDSSPTATCAPPNDTLLASTNCPVTGFEIQEQDSNNLWVVREGVGAAVRSRQIPNLVAGTRKCFRIRTNSNGTFSNPIPVDGACATVSSVSPRGVSGVTVVTVEVSVSTPTP